MKKNEIRSKLEETASKKIFFDKYDEEAEEIFEEWNNLVTEAENVGMTHTEISEIWEANTWGSFRG